MEQTQKMNPEAKAKVIEALRSGNYTQGQSVLRDASNCFCVWGVICDVSEVSQWRRRRSGNFEYGDFAMGPSTEVLGWTGAVFGEKVEINGVLDNLMNHNDNGATFAQLADAIEAQL
jgi:hypothetical protein